MTISDSNLTPGEVLIAAREKASLSLEQVAESTRIAPNMLRAIELDEYHKISGDLYVKSFLRSYAEAVNLEAEELVELYLAYTGAAAGDSGGAQPASWEEQDVKITKVGLPWGWIVLGVCLIAGSYFLYQWWAGKTDGETQSVNATPAAAVVTDAAAETGAASADSAREVSAAEDTLALGWQLEIPTEQADSVKAAGGPPGTGKLHLPEALVGDSKISFSGGHHWSYVVRVISELPGDFAVKRDAESAFKAASFPKTLEQAKPLPLENIVAGQAYAVRRGFVVYWGADDHLSLRLGQIKGVEVSFNGIIQDVVRFNIGEEILLDASRLNRPAGN